VVGVGVTQVGVGVGLVDGSGDRGVPMSLGVGPVLGGPDVVGAVGVVLVHTGKVGAVGLPPGFG
jgi:hypothetical protein